MKRNEVGGPLFEFFPKAVLRYPPPQSSPPQQQALQDKMKEEESLKWFSEELLPALIKSGRFSENGEIQSLQKCVFETIEKGVLNFASVPSFAMLILNTPTGQISRNVIVKFQCQDPIFRENMKLNFQFRNEVTMYMKVLPSFSDFLSRCGQNRNLIEDIVPKCYFAIHNDENPEKSVLIMKDLRKEGYGMSTFVTELDLEHCLVAFERLAQFHAISFAMKCKKWELFDELKKSFLHVWFENNEWTKNLCKDFKGCCVQRGIDYLMSQENSEVPLEYLENFKKMLEPAGLFDFLRDLHSPKEPLSVICHGDFNRNNVLYKYSNGKVIDAKLIDFQTFLYGSPCLDLSFFIYMNTTLEFREKHFDAIFEHYHSTLIERVSLILNDPKETIAERFPLEAFREEFAKIAITAYVTVAFFLPVMMIPQETDFEEDMKQKSFKELGSENYVQGGDVVSKRIAEVIVDFYRRKFYRNP